MSFPYTPANVDAAIAEIRTTVATIASAWATDVQSQMRSDAPWNDQNGPSMTGLNARQSLETQVAIQSGNILIVARSSRQSLRAWGGWGGAPVGAFLELGTRFMANRAVIRPTMQSMAGDLFASIEAALGG